MSGWVWIADHLVRRLEGVDDTFRADVALTVHDALEVQGTAGRVGEVASLAGLVLRLRARSRTAAGGVDVWRQGLALGGAALLVAHAALVVAAVRAGGPTEPQAAALAVGVLVGLAAIVAGPLPGRRCAAAALIALVAGTLAPHAVSAALPVVMAVALPCVLLAVGWFDPRFAAAATLVVFARLLASGFDELGTALDVLAADGDRVLLVRWIVMGFGVVAAWVVTQRASDRLVR
ncbi:MAG: hypothetical protein ACEQSX_04610 [Baekduiaceae bacterium]